ncbi:MAG: MarR family transcriptional regulator [Alphaproteobacteria bacterium]|nr:MarR family transcriptional regulator [Alphaproteobacteria bacterium]
MDEQAAPPPAKNMLKRGAESGRKVNMGATFPPSPLFLREDELRLGVSLLHAAAQNINTAQNRLLEKHGIGPAQQRLLAYLALESEVPVATLITLFQISKQNLWRALRPLLKRGLITAATDPRDKRRKILSLTGAGRQIAEQISHPALQLLAQAYKNEGAEATEGFRRILHALAPQNWADSGRPSP